jgi:histidinol-phosphate/aromatic aminotransferase/cobyric acid decarboxylase-like protein
MKNNLKIIKKDLDTIQEEMYNKILKLKLKSGTHSPSIFNMKEYIPELNFKVDACFLSNPYATDLFISYLDKEIIQTNKFRDLLEFYPSQMGVIANKLSSVLDVSSDNIFVGNGAIEAIQAVIHRFVKKKILINIPTFSSYYEFVREDVEVVYNNLLPENNFEISTDSIIDTVNKNKVDSIVLINPNNPDGSYFSIDDITLILEQLRHLDTIIVDESFIHFAYENEYFTPLSVTSLVNDFPNLIVIKSMSKDFGIAGLRAGYAVMNKSRVSQLRKNGYLWNVSGFTEYFFDLYSRKDFLEEYEIVRKKYILETKDFLKEFNRLEGIKVYPTKANFILVELLNGMNSDEFVFKMLVKFGVYTRTCSDKIGIGDNFIRVASRNKKENEIIISSFKKMLDGNE